MGQNGGCHSCSAQRRYPQHTKTGAIGPSARFSKARTIAQITRSRSARRLRHPELDQAAGQGLRPRYLRRFQRQKTIAPWRMHISFWPICGQHLPCAIIERQELMRDNVTKQSPDRLARTSNRGKSPAAGRKASLRNPGHHPRARDAGARVREPLDRSFQIHLTGQLARPHDELDLLR